ncbi:MAG: tRNA (adenosine(37)-N6)-threonylcarbamoyltransferase complex transferase subunit TsaD [Chitinophagales bacterium]|nr:tRNA (adenosine(37)-N6)-threonylcarbamoyltransferase complex transferase subunit TsaD [Bacteroidota bacterium]MCB9043265.1 tRNA (adenosine(37)-N6)-threonylcarbamoyltransferase complex transferase subunit TsaD [Chitinophagales bacterium]
MSKDIYILGIESSCDDTSAAICYNGKILSNITASQKIHEEWGGVVPELASRAHQENIVPVVDAAFKRAGITPEKLSAVAFTRGPGLIGSLLVGASFAKSFAMALEKPIIATHHMVAHILAHFIDEPKPAFPFICLTVSGGHTQLVLVKNYLDMEIIGTTVDDAAGEAFDKTAKMLGLAYPGGPLLDKLAQQGNAQAFTFAQSSVGELNFSFSGLKTSVLYFLQKQAPDFVEKNLSDLCASIQYTIVQMLMKQLIKASEQYNIREIAIAGGVSANSGLRQSIAQTGAELGWNTYIPAFQYCTDNAAMIAITAYFQFLENDFAAFDVSPLARWQF